MARWGLADDADVRAEHDQADVRAEPDVCRCRLRPTMPMVGRSRGH